MEALLNVNYVRDEWPMFVLEYSAHLQHLSSDEPLTICDELQSIEMFAGSESPVYSAYIGSMQNHSINGLLNG